MIEVRDLTKRYGSTLAVDALSFDLRPGVVTGFLGPNGAGKSTTMRLILGLDSPDAGQARIGGRRYRDLRWPLREAGALPEAKAFHPGRSARAHLAALAASNAIDRCRVDEVLDQVGLTGAARKRTTALHWLPGPALRALYAELATALRPGGLLLDGDHFKGDESACPVIERLDEALIERAEQRRLPQGHPETWTGWWEAAAADPDLAELAAQRERLSLDSEHHGSPSGWLATHVEALRAAGFSEVGTLWQRGNNRILCGVRGVSAR